MAEQQLRFDGRVAIVTGAGSGLGRIYALALALRGARVLVNDAGVSGKGEGVNNQVADFVVAEIRAAGGEAEANYDSIEFGREIVRAAVKCFGRVDILINNAGIRRDARFGKITNNDWNLVLKTSIFGTFCVTKYVWEHMKAQRYGRVVMVGTWTGLYGNIGQTNYATANMGILGLSRSLSREGAPYGIKVNTVLPIASSRLSPHPFDTSDDFAKFSPEKVAPLVLFLSHHACDVSGKIVEVGGGVVDVVRWQRAKGAMFSGDFSAEDIARRWKEVEDFEQGEEVVDVETELEKVKRKLPSKL